VRFLLFVLVFTSVVFSRELVSPLPNVINYDKQKAQLGKKLFFDPILSKDGTITCANCHDLESGGDDGMSTSIGINGQRGSVNAPTVLNSRYNFVQFWDGRAKNLQEQALGPIHNPVEMGSSLKEVVKKLNNNPNYTKLFKKIYDDGVTIENITDAIAEFEKALVTPDSRFDRYLRGEKNALNKEEKQGYKLFKSLGCISCHNGVNIGGNLYQKMGIFSSIPDKNNTGRYKVTKNEMDKYFFKVPSLRNISKTAPYFHNGKEKDLKNAIKTMLQYQLGRDITKEENELLYKFLLTLDGKKPEILNEK